MIHCSFVIVASSCCRGNASYLSDVPENIICQSFLSSWRLFALYIPSEDVICNSNMQSLPVYDGCACNDLLPLQDAYYVCSRSLSSFILQLAFVWDILLLMAKNVSEPDFVSGDRSMSYGRKKLADGTIAETRRNMSKRDTSQESRFFMKQARKILWEQLRGTPLKTGKFF